MSVADALRAPPELPSDLRWMQWGARALFAVAVVLAVLLAVLWVAKRPALQWRQIVVQGDVTRNSLATLRANALPHVRGNFLTTDLAKTRAAFEAVPWVRRAEVRRVWPAQLKVTLEEHRAVATWDGRGDWGEPPLERALLNSHGEVFHANLGEVEDEDLPQLAGPNGSEAQVLRLWQTLGGLSGQDDRLALTRLELSGRGSWRATWSSGATIELGRGTPDELLERYRQFLPHALAVARRFNTQVQSADLRHPDGYALRLVGIGTQQTPAKPANKPIPKRKP
jgi:cell division protein FtsQ